jgi:hypothetical protein
VEAAGVELFNVLTARNLLIRRTTRRAQKATLPIPLYVYCTKIFPRPSGNGHQKPSIPHFTAVAGEELVFPPIFTVREAPLF